MKTIAGVFRLYPWARDAVDALERAGFSKNQITLWCSPSQKKEVRHTRRASHTEPPGVGGAMGGV